MKLLRLNEWTSLSHWRTGARERNHMQTKQSNHCIHSLHSNIIEFHKKYIYFVFQWYTQFTTGICYVYTQWLWHQRRMLCRQTMRRSALTYNMWRGNRCDTITAMMYYLINEYNDYEANIECASNSFSLLDHLFIWGDRWRRYEQDI